MMNKFIQKLTSRKFLCTLAGIVTGVAVIASGNTTEGTITLITSVVAYLTAEGIIDAKAVKNVAQGVADSVDKEVQTDD